MKGFTEITLNERVTPIIAVGADIANAVCFAYGNTCYLSKPVGDLSLLDNLNAFKNRLRDASHAMGDRRFAVACDAHPLYHSTQIAKQLAQKKSCTLVEVQHHKAHVASVALEHGFTDYVGIACDGLGYGDDGTLWGGEIFRVRKGSIFERVGHLEQHVQVGGDSAAIYPRKMLYSILSQFLKPKQMLDFFSEDEMIIYQKQIRNNFNVYKTTSTGRILDALSVMLGVCEKRTYEGEPAILFEKAAGNDFLDIEPVIQKESGINILRTIPLFSFVYENRQEDTAKLAMTAHMYLARGLYRIAQGYDNHIVFSGGVAYNKIISSYLEKKGVLLHREIEPGDSGIAFGQLSIANRLLSDH